MAFLPLLVAALASVVLWLGLRRRLRLEGRRLGAAVSSALETVGLLVVFLAADLALGVVLALAARAAGRFVSLYLAVDASLIFLALLQALVFQRWWEGARDR
jgi:hypothetical protein